MPRIINFFIGINILFCIFWGCSVEAKKSSLEMEKKYKDAPYQVWVSYSNECPFCIRYTRNLREIRDSLPAKWKFKFLKINPKENWDFDWSFPLSGEVFHDSDLVMARFAGLSVFPEAVIIDSAGQILYRGPIDNRAIETGLNQTTVQKNHLENAIQAILNHQRPHQPFPQAKGCFIEYED